MSNSAENILKGLEAYERGSYEAAAAALQEALTLQPDAPDALINLGNVYFRQQNYAECRRVWRRATEVDPLNPAPYINLGNLYYAQAQQLLAVGQWEIALSLVTGEAPSLLLKLGVAYEFLRKPTLAYDYYARYLSCRSVSPDDTRNLKTRLANANTVARHNLLKAENAMQRGALETACAAFSQSLTIVPFPVKYYQHYATVLYKLARYKEALFWFEAANTAEIHELNVLVNLGVLYEKFGDSLQMLWAYQLAIRLFPSNVPKAIQDRYLIMWHEKGKTSLADGVKRVEAEIAEGRYGKAERLAHRIFDLTCKQTPDNLDAAQAVLDKLADVCRPGIRIGRLHYRAAQQHDTAGRHAEALNAFDHFLHLCPDDELAGATRNRCAELRTLMQLALTQEDALPALVGG